VTGAAIHKSIYYMPTVQVAGAPAVLLLPYSVQPNGSITYHLIMILPALLLFLDEEIIAIMNVFLFLFCLGS
jgi:hypothetical protein